MNKKDKHTIYCIVCDAEFKYQTKKEADNKLRKIWSNIRKLFLKAYDNLFIYG